MNEFWKSVVADSISGFIVAIGAISATIGAAIFTVRKSLEQFYLQKRWGKKSEAYSAINEDLSRLFFCIKKLCAEATGEIQIDDHRYKTLNNEYITRLESLEIILAGGAFDISKEVYEEIKKLIDNLNKNYYKQQKESFADYLDRDYEVIEKFKDGFNELVKKDLNI